MTNPQEQKMEQVPECEHKWVEQPKVDRRYEYCKVCLQTKQSWLEDQLAKHAAHCAGEQKNDAVPSKDWDALCFEIWKLDDPELADEDEVHEYDPWEGLRNIAARLAAEQGRERAVLMALVDACENAPPIKLMARIGDVCAMAKDALAARPAEPEAERKEYPKSAVAQNHERAPLKREDAEGVSAAGADAASAVPPADNSAPAAPDIARLRELLDLISPGEWSVRLGHVQPGLITHYIDPLSATRVHYAADAKFICVARNALPALLERLERAERQVKMAVLDRDADRQERDSLIAERARMREALEFIATRENPGKAYDTWAIEFARAALERGK